MKRIILIGILLILLAGCGDDGPVSLDWVDFYTDYNKVTFTVNLDNQTDESVFVDVKVDIQDEWLANQMESDYEVKANGYEVEDASGVKLDRRDYGHYVFLKYNLKEKVNERDLKDAVYHNGIEVQVLTESGEILAKETSRHFDYRDNQDDNIKIIIIAVIGLFVVLWAFEKFIRMFLNVRKIDKKDYPKVYRWVNGVLHFLGSVMLSLIPLFSGLINFWTYLLIVVLLTFIPLVVLDLIYLKQTRNYQVNLLIGLFLILIITIGQQLFPYILY